MTAPDTFGAILEEFDTPESAEPEAPAPDAAAPADDAAHAAEPDAVHPRDEQGRFTKKPEPDADSDAQSEAAAPMDAEAEAPTTEPENPLAHAQPFAVRVNGEEATLDGGHILPGEGALFSADALPRLQEIVSRGLLYERERHAFEAERRAFAAERAKPSANEVKYERAASTLLGALSNEETLAQLFDPQVRQLFLQRLAVDLDKLDLEHQRGAYTARETAETTAQQEQAVTQHVTAQVAELAKQYPELTAPDIQQAQRYAESIRGALVRTVGPNDVEFLQAGWQVGQPYMVHAPIEQYLSAIVAERKAAAAKAANAEKAAAFNRQQQSAAKPKPTPVASGKAPGKKAPAKSGKDTFNDAFREWTKSPGLALGDDDE